MGRPREATLDRPTKGGRGTKWNDDRRWDLNVVYWEGFVIPSPPSPPAPGVLYAAIVGTRLAASFASRRLQDDVKTRRRREDVTKTIRRRLGRLQEGSRGQLSPNFGPSWTPSGRPNPVKTYGFSMLLLLHSFASSDAQDGPKTAPRAPQEAPRRPQEAPRGPRRPPKGSQETLKKAEESPKTPPKQHQS